MRTPCRRPLQVRQTIIGGENPLLCVPMVAITPSALLAEARAVVALKPDIIEWRADFLGGLQVDNLGELLSSMRRLIGETPLIFTYRSPLEGGHAPTELSARLNIINAALPCPAVDIVDLELQSGQEAVAAVRQEASSYHKLLLLSWHNFVATPDEATIRSQLTSAVALGADIAKVAVMPQNNRDVLALLGATIAARQECPDTPLITMSMGAKGLMSRLFGGNFGSDITFAQGLAPSAPGQIPVGALRDIWKVLS